MALKCRVKRFLILINKNILTTGHFDFVPKT